MIREDFYSLIKKSRGLDKAELVLKNARIVSVFTNEIISGDIAIEDGKILGIGNYEGREEVDLKGKFVVPGLIDGHVHIESSMSSPSEFSKVLLKNGVTSIIADPHEIANIKGLAGIEYIIEDSKNTPLDVYIMLPSCVPSTSFETSGAILKAEDLEKIICEESVLGLGEMMNYPGVLNGDKDVLDKLLMFDNRVIDGHGPMIEGNDLNVYIYSGIDTDHECSTIEEVENRLRLGMNILIRQGSAAKDLKNIIGAVNKDNLGSFVFCTDDKHPRDLLSEGSINYNIKLAVEEGMDPIDAIKIATINAARCYGLSKKGAIAPGYMADLLVVDNLESFNIQSVYKSGEIVYDGEDILVDMDSYLPKSMLNSINIGEIKEKDLEIRMETISANIISVQKASLITKKLVRDVMVEDGLFKYSDEDIAKLLVIERHNNTGNIGLGLVENFNISNGAIGTTIGHDSHNLMVIGDNDRDILSVIDEIKKNEGGIAISQSGTILESLALEIGGIMSSRPLEEINEKFNNMVTIAYDRLNINRDIDPFMTLSFLALPVIPDIKLTDKGLFDVKEFKFIDIYNK